MQCRLLYSILLLCIFPGNYMDVDTVPISEEELPVQTKGSDDVAMKSNAKAQQDTAPQVQPSTTRPARPKAAVRRRR